MFIVVPFKLILSLFLYRGLWHRSPLLKILCLYYLVLFVFNSLVQILLLRISPGFILFKIFKCSLSRKERLLFSASFLIEYAKMLGFYFYRRAGHHSFCTIKAVECLTWFLKLVDIIWYIKMILFYITNCIICIIG